MGKKKLQIPLIAIFSVIGGILYRMGGSGNWPRQSRTVGIAILSALLLAVLGGWCWWILFCIPLLIGATSTYWKKKGTDALWYHWALHALGISLAMFPWVISTGHYLGFAIRSLILVALVTIYSEKVSNAVAEELGRGFLVIATIPLLLI